VTADLVATCWTTSGNARPLGVSEVSPYTPFERIDAVADDGWVGLGFAHQDLDLMSRTTGFSDVADHARSRGLQHVEVELVGDWWLDDAVWRPRWALLLKAAEAFGAPFIKAGTAFSTPWSDLGPLVEPLRHLAQEAAEHGTKVALEPLPFSMVGSLPAGAELVERVGHPVAGLAVDFWHVFRAGTSLAELRARLSPEMVLAVELNDADAQSVGDLFEDTRDRRRYCGEGSQDVVGFVATMKDLGFTGPWGVEILSEEHRAAGLRSGLERARTTTLACLSQTNAS